MVIKDVCSEIQAIKTREKNYWFFQVEKRTRPILAQRR